MVDDTVQVPPRTGPGATVEAWEEYARLTGVEHPKGATRDEIQEAVDAVESTAGTPEFVESDHEPVAKDSDGGVDDGENTTSSSSEGVPDGGAEGVAGDAPAPATGDTEEDGDADEVPAEETAANPNATPPPPEAPQEEVTFVVAGQNAPDFARAPNRPKTELVVRLEGKTVQFRGGRFTTSDPEVIDALDALAEQHSDGKVVEITRQTPDGEEKFFKWDSHAEVREAGRPGYDGPPRNTLGIRRAS